MGSLTFLEWDSHFFNKKIGEITIDNNTSNKYLEEELNNATNENYNLVYLFTETKHLVDNSILDSFNGYLIDTKLIFHKNLNTDNYTTHPNIKAYPNNGISEDLIQLSYLSGTFSRFNRDRWFKESDFKRLYLEWVQKSISRELSDQVFVYYDKDKIVGFITIVVKGNVGKIGLIAVDPSYQGKKIGSLLIERVSNFLINKNVTQLEVPTQQINTFACKFYLKNNFNIISKKNIYHFILH